MGRKLGSKLGGKSAGIKVGKQRYDALVAASAHPAVVATSAHPALSQSLRAAPWCAGPVPGRCGRAAKERSTATVSVCYNVPYIKAFSRFADAALPIDASRPSEFF
jgi:hypothetical protein